MIIEPKNIEELALKLDISVNTINRWNKLNKIPTQYKIQLLNHSTEENKDYSEFSPKEKDQFFTQDDTVKYCYDIFCDKMSELYITKEDYQFIEPSAGDGSFMKILPEDTIGLDIEPKGKYIQKQNYLEWQPVDNKKIYSFWKSSIWITRKSCFTIY